MTITPNPYSFDQLSRLAAPFREDVVRRAEGQRWCWIPEWDSDNDVYWLGTKVEGQTTWVKALPIQKGFGPTARNLIDRLNEREGLSPDEWRQIWSSGGSSAKAYLSEDETEVILLLRGTPHQTDVTPSSGRPRRGFTLEYDLALDLFRGLYSIQERHILPYPSDNNRDVEVVIDEFNDDGDVTLYVPGEYEVDPHDMFCFTLMIDFQTAADLYASMPDVFAIDIMMLGSPEDLLGDI